DFYFEKGFAEMLPKPFTKQELIVALKKIFPHSHMFTAEKSEDQTLEIESSNNEKFDLSLLKSFLYTPKALEDVLEVFNSQTEKDLQQIKSLIVEKDVKSISELTHRMLTMFRQIKAKEVIPILEKMEFYTEMTEHTEMQIDFKKLTVSIRELQKALRN